MDMQSILDNAVAQIRKAELDSSDQLLLGELILKLEAVTDRSKPLFIDIRDLRPIGVDSWRGSYNELAIQTTSLGSRNTDEVETEVPGYGPIYKSAEIGKENPTVQEWIEVLKEAVGVTFTGYKGGVFLMSKNTPVWLAEYSEYTFNITDDVDEYKKVYFVDVLEEADRVYLKTHAIDA